MTATIKGHDTFVNILIRHGASVHTIDSKGNNVLILAALFGHASIIELLVQYGADVDRWTSTGETALMCAGKNSYL